MEILNTNKHIFKKQLLIENKFVNHLEIYKTMKKWKDSGVLDDLIVNYDTQTPFLPIRNNDNTQIVPPKDDDDELDIF